MVKYGGFWRATPDFVYRLTTMVSGFTYIPSFEVPDGVMGSVAKEGWCPIAVAGQVLAGS